MSDFQALLALIEKYPIGFFILVILMAAMVDSWVEDLIAAYRSRKSGK